ncbi:MAG: TauD/TfdA family dioxygenase [Myxococcota bacterium]
MTLQVTPSGQACGAFVEGVDLSRALEAETVAEIRAAWLEHHVVVFPDQTLSDDDLERYALYFGPFGHDPFFESIPGHDHIAAIRRNADETTSIFAETWHTDWSFQKNPPIATCLYGIEIPPTGGDTLYANQHAAFEAMPEDLRARFEGLRAIHSARLGYSKDGIYGDAEADSDRSMKIVASDEALEEESHPLVRPHPETGRLGIFGAPLSYIIGFEDVEPEESTQLMKTLHAWQTRDEFLYRHVWEKDMLVMWDNRSVLHRATGGYEGHDRLLHRTTIGATC